MPIPDHLRLDAAGLSSDARCAWHMCWSPARTKGPGQGHLVKWQGALRTQMALLSAPDFYRAQQASLDGAGTQQELQPGTRLHVVVNIQLGVAGRACQQHVDDQC